MTVLVRPIERALPRPIERSTWCVQIDSTGVSFRQKGHRTRFHVGWDSIFYRAMELAAAEARRKKRVRAS